LWRASGPPAGRFAHAGSLDDVLREPDDLALEAEGDQNWADTPASTAVTRRSDYLSVGDGLLLARTRSPEVRCASAQLKPSLPKGTEMPQASATDEGTKIPANREARDSRATLSSTRVLALQV